MRGSSQCHYWFCSAWIQLHTNLILGPLQTENRTDGVQRKGTDAVTEAYVFDNTYKLPPQGHPEDNGLSNNNVKVKVVLLRRMRYP